MTPHDDFAFDDFGKVIAHLIIAGVVALFAIGGLTWWLS